MFKSKSKEIKREQKASLILKEVSKLFSEVFKDNEKLRHLSITKIKLSPDKSFCSIFFYSPEGKDKFIEKLEILKLYKPSLRSAIAKKIKSRYTPDFRFKFDTSIEKQEKISKLLDKLKEKGEL